MLRPWIQLACGLWMSSLVGCSTNRATSPEPSPGPAAEPTPAQGPASEPGVPQPSAAAPDGSEKKPSDPAVKQQDASGDPKREAALERRPSEPEKKPRAENKREGSAAPATAQEAQAAQKEVVAPNEAKAATAQAPKAEPAKTAAAPATVAGPCGEKGQPRCPLQAWMEDHLQAAVDKADVAAIAKSLSRVPSFVPDPSWNAGDQGWSALANNGVDAAKKGDIDAVKASCKACHKAWRSKYKQQYRLRTIAD